MTARYSLLMLLSGVILLGIASILQFLNLPYVSLTRLMGIGLEVMGMTITVIKILRYPAAKPFLDR
ncbi:MAG TPA: hypothetical protein PLN54_06740 [Flavobacteriales bacterium]|nr:hypothetical protein [Flavobacteriales bacterium]